jgi:acetylglutamate kinase
VLSVRVVKLGGNELDRPGWLAACARALARLDPVIVVHGGGRAVSALSQRLGLPVEKRDGVRVTTPDVAEVVELVLAGPVNRAVVVALRAAGLDAVGLSGVDGGLFTARPRAPELGLVGEIADVRASLLESFVLAGLTPVIAPTAPTAPAGGGPPLNVNADDAAAAVAGALHASELLLVSDVPGVWVDGTVQPAIDVGDIEALIELGAAGDGMAAKLRAASAALRPGGRSQHLGRSRRRHAHPRRRRSAGVTAVPAAASALLDVYARVGPLFVAGDGAELVAEDGARYLDFVAGIAVNALGYNHPVLRGAIERGLSSGLIHVSNLYRTEGSERLAAELVARSFADRVFFCNSGAEANEAAFKFARKWAGKSEIVAFSGSFHGRLFATLAATDRPDYRKPFEPLVPGIRIVPREDWAAVDHAVSASRTAAVIVEPVQGEGGVRPVDPEWLGFVRELCDSRGVAVIFDEVQCGLGRTGTLFAYEQTGVVPDLLTLAKPLGGGLPMGAVLVTGAIAAALKPGDHATTFGGGPLVAGVAVEVLRTIGEPAFLAEVRRKGTWLGERLLRLAERTRRVAAVRGRGLMWGVELTEPAAPYVAQARERHLLVITAGPTVLRLVPPLVISDQELERGVGILEEVLQ